MSALLPLLPVLPIAAGKSMLAPFGIGLAFFVIAGALTDLVERTGLFRVPLATVRARAAGLPRSTWGTAVAHCGLALTLLGIVCVTNWATERIIALKPGQTVSLSGYDFKFDGMDNRTGPNFTAVGARFSVRKGGVPIGVMESAKRTFGARGMTTTESALMTRGLSQLYLSLGDSEANGAIGVRIYYKPMVLLIWIGAIVMMLGGGLSLSDRRLRVGAPKPAKKQAAKSSLQPAE